MSGRTPPEGRLVSGLNDGDIGASGCPVDPSASSDAHLASAAPPHPGHEDTSPSQTRPSWPLRPPSSAACVPAAPAAGEDGVDSRIAPAVGTVTADTPLSAIAAIDGAGWRDDGPKGSACRSSRLARGQSTVENAVGRAAAGLAVGHADGAAAFERLASTSRPTTAAASPARSPRPPSSGTGSAPPPPARWPPSHGGRPPPSGRTRRRLPNRRTVGATARRRAPQGRPGNPPATAPPAAAVQASETLPADRQQRGEGNGGPLRCRNHVPAAGSTTMRVAHLLSSRLGQRRIPAAPDRRAKLQ